MNLTPGAIIFLSTLSIGFLIYGFWVVFREEK